MTINKCQSAPTLTSLPKIRPDQIPNLPGNTICPRLGKDRHTKSQVWGYVNGQRMEVKEGLSYDKPKFVRAPKPADTWRKGSLPNSTYKAIFQSPSLKEWDLAPAWDVFDRHVLRFYGFAKEAMTEMNMQNNKTRRITILYYLEDDTIQVNEKKMVNNGCGIFASAGGLADKGLSSCIVRRHRIPAPAGSELQYITPKDLTLGKVIEIYSRIYRLTGCDQFTREYYQSVGTPQPTDYEPKDAPNDDFDALKENRAKLPIRPPKTLMKYYSESMLGGGHINRNMQQFMEDRYKVCRYYAMYDDLVTPQFERRPFIILYFVVDGTIEVREQYPTNCGRENYPVFLKRQKVPRTRETEVRGPMDSVFAEDELLNNIDDLGIGKTVCICKFDFMIYDVDEFTRKYYSEELKKPLPDPIDMRLPATEVPRPPTPPYTGYGTWDDSMASVIHLVPKVPRKDLIKLFANTGKTLRFTSKFGGNVLPEDLDRRFVFSYHLHDDTVAIHEPPQRNLGIVTGKFLKNGIHCNEATKKLFTPKDLLPGQMPTVLSHNFIMLDMDEYTRKWFKAKEESMPMKDEPANLNVVLEKLRESIRQQMQPMKDSFRKFDVDRNGVLCYFEFDRVLQKYSFVLSPEETLMIMKQFDTNGNGQVDYNEFCQTVFGEDYRDPNEPKAAPITEKADAAAIQPYAQQAAIKTVDRNETEKVRKACKDIGQVLYTRPNLEFRLREDLRHVLRTTRLVTPTELKTSFKKVGIDIDLIDFERCFQYLMRESDCGDEQILKVDYNKFFAEMKCSYYDLAHPR